MKREPIEAAELFIDRYFPNASIVVLAGSVVQGGAAASSDLDLVVIDNTQSIPFRRTYYEYGWLIEAFVLTHSSYKDLFAESYNSAIPSLQRMFVLGRILRDDGSAADIIEEARMDLEQGPLPWNPEDMEKIRYEITECLDDLADSGSREEVLYIAGKLSLLVPTFVLRAARQWIGDGKWLIRSLRSYDESLCDRWVAALDELYLFGNKHQLIGLTDQILAPYGGRLSEGYMLEGISAYWDEEPDEEPNEKSDEEPNEKPDEKSEKTG